MTIHEAMNTPARQWLLSVCFLLLSMQMVLLFASARDGRSRAVQAGYLLWLLAGAAVFYLPMYDISRENYNPGMTGPYPPAAGLILSLPVTVLVLYEAVNAAAVFAAWRNLIKYRGQHPTNESIKETMDLLPAGIAFGKPDGAAVFANLTMNVLAKRLTGRRFLHMTDLKEAAAGKQERDAAVLSDGTGVWQLSGEELELDGERYYQLTATDITEQAAIAEELREKNKKLRELQRRLDLYSRQADRIIIAQELLAARMTVHSEVGNVLLECRHYLTAPSAIDEELLLQALKNTNTYLLKEYEEDDTGGDPLPHALAMAEAIGVEVTITGGIPSKDPCRSILAAAITECASNTVKHAGGDRLCADVRESGGSVTFVLQNNGEQPLEIRETGGLLSLRSLTEREHGTMRIECSPAFRLIITLPKGRPGGSAR